MMIEKRLLAGLIASCGLMLSSCHSVYMSAEDRLQENYEEADASVEMDDELSAFSYSDVSVIPYTIENLAKGFTNLSESEVERLKTCDQYNHWWRRKRELACRLIMEMSDFISMQFPMRTLKNI